MIRAVLIFSMASGSLFLNGCAKQAEVSGPAYTQISAEEAKEKMDTLESYVIVDVRTRQEFAEDGHIPGAVCVPVESIEEKAPADLPDRDQVLLVYCRSGNRSRQAAEKLVNMGYTNVFEFGGIRDWPYETVSEDREAPADLTLVSENSEPGDTDGVGLEVTGFHDMILESAITNHSDEPYSYGNPFSLQIFENGEWKDMEWTEQPVWTMIAYELQAGESAARSDDLTLIKNLRKGTYRLITGDLEAQFELTDKE
jgi:rhodanese-related sulfurtransferase